LSGFFIDREDFLPIRSFEKVREREKLPERRGEIPPLVSLCG
jgi:hypothetical protein